MSIASNSAPIRHPGSGCGSTQREEPDLQSSRPPGTKRFLRLILFVGAFTLGSSCDRPLESPELPSPAAPDDGAAAVARLKRAQSLLDEALRAAPGERTVALREVAHLYWDTEPGRRAYTELVLALILPETDRIPEAIEEVRRFHRQAPDAPEVGSCASIFACNRKLWETADGSAVPEDLVALREEALGIWIESSEKLAATAEKRHDWSCHDTLATAYVFARRYADAEKTWAAVEGWTPPASAMERFRALRSRAEVWRSHLQDPEKALALLEQAREIGDGDATLITDVERRWVRDQIDELRSRPR